MNSVFRRCNKWWYCYWILIVYLIVLSLVDRLSLRLGCFKSLSLFVRLIYTQVSYVCSIIGNVDEQSHFEYWSLVKQLILINVTEIIDWIDCSARFKTPSITFLKICRGWSDLNGTMYGSAACLWNTDVTNVPFWCKKHRL
jgi:hypothetical protein